HLISQRAPEKKITALLDKIDVLNDQLTVLEGDFSYVLGEGSRWLERTLMFVLILAVLIVEGTGLFLSITLSRNLSKGLHELSSAAQQVGLGKFETQVPVRSRDELGQLAQSLNKMAADLHNSIGERQQAEQANRLKSLFLANMSHEIRTPLGAIIGFSDLLKDPNLSESERLQYVDIIHRTGENLTHIINDILDLSKVEAGHLQIEKNSFSLSSFLEDLRLLMIARCGDKDIKIEFEKQGPVPEMIETDALRLRQILTNILGNAIKFTDHGFVRMTYEVSGAHLLFTIRDTGVGISSDGASRLFQAFSQIDSSVTRKYEGTGLGLVLSKKLAQLMRGDVTLQESQIGRGSTFSVRIQFETAEGSPTLPAPENREKASPYAHQLSNISILLVDDVEDNRLLIQRILSRRGATLFSAANGEDGVQKALEGQHDLVLMDIQMPVMDGYTATKKLRQAGYKKPIIALTAHAMKDDRDLCLDAGCTDYLTKPVQIPSLVETILKYAKT
ncbi:MAG: response regulator, partial [Bdellovibrio sp.]